MNNLEKISQLLLKPGRKIIYGEPVDGTEQNLVSLSIGESDLSKSVLGGHCSVEYTTIVIAVYADDYLDGYNEILAIKDEIESANDAAICIKFVQYGDSGYNAELGKHALKTYYKIID